MNEVYGEVLTPLLGYGERQQTLNKLRNPTLTPTVGYNPDLSTPPQLITEPFDATTCLPSAAIIVVVPVPPLLALPYNALCALFDALADILILYNTLRKKI